MPPLLSAQPSCSPPLCLSSTCDRPHTTGIPPAYRMHPSRISPPPLHPTWIRNPPASHLDPDPSCMHPACMHASCMHASCMHPLRAGRPFRPSAVTLCGHHYDAAFPCHPQPHIPPTRTRIGSPERPLVLTDRGRPHRLRLRVPGAPCGMRLAEWWGGSPDQIAWRTPHPPLHSRRIACNQVAFGPIAWLMISYRMQSGRVWPYRLADDLRGLPFA